MQRWHLWIKNQGSHFCSAITRILRHIHICKIVLKCLFTLDSAVAYFTDFVRIETLPSFTVKLLKKVNNVYGVDEIDEGVAHIASVFEIDGQVEEVILIILFSVECIKKHLLRILVRNILDHHGGSTVFVVYYPLDIQVEVRLTIS